mgnify:CR=1 FL=1
MLGLSCVVVAIAGEVVGVGSEAVKLVLVPVVGVVLAGVTGC